MTKTRGVFLPYLTSREAASWLLLSRCEKTLNASGTRPLLKRYVRLWRINVAVVQAYMRLFQLVSVVACALFEARVFGLDSHSR